MRVRSLMQHRAARAVLAFLVTAATALPFAGKAADLRMGMVNPPTLDPHFFYVGTNVAYNTHIYSAVTQVDSDGHLQPDLAESWTAVSDKVWRFKLRHDVTFHDGRPFTADDVVFSFRRVPNVPNNPASYIYFIVTVTEIRKVDDYTIEIVTDRPNPILPLQIAGLLVVSQHAAAGMSTEDFNNGKAAVGSGPYRYVEFTDRNRLVLVRNEAYFGGRPDWDRVEFRVMSNDAARSAALLAGDVDLIEAVPARDAAPLARNTSIIIHAGVAPRVMYIGVVVDDGGKAGSTAIAANPLVLPMVRKAMSHAINRAGMVESLLNGYGQTAGQIAVPGTIGYVGDVAVDTYDPELARRLLQEAGFPDGFSTSLICTNDRYVADAATCQAVGQMLARVGIKVAVEPLPSSVYFSRMAPGASQVQLYLGSWGNSRGDNTTTLSAMYHKMDRIAGLGASNRSGWSDPASDREIEALLVERDSIKRLGYLESAARIGIEARPYIPLFSSPLLVASRANVDYTPGTAGNSELTMAMKAHPR